MSRSTSLRTRLASIAVGVLVGGLAAGGVAAATTTSTTSAGTKPAATSTDASSVVRAARLPDRRALSAEFRRLLRHTVHAELIVDTKSGFKTVDIDRGTLTASPTTSISIVRPDGPTVTAAVTSSTRFRGIAEAKLASGDREIVVQSGGNALVVISLKPKSA